MPDTRSKKKNRKTEISKTCFDSTIRSISPQAWNRSSSNPGKETEIIKKRPAFKSQGTHLNSIPVPRSRIHRKNPKNRKNRKNRKPTIISEIRSNFLKDRPEASVHLICFPKNQKSTKTRKTKNWKACFEEACFEENLVRSPSVSKTQSDLCLLQ